MGISGVYNSHFQVTTYWILDHTIMDVDVNNAADIGVGKLNHTALLTDNNSGTISWICAAGSSSAGAAGGITTGAGAGSNNVGGTLTLTAGNSVGSGVGAKVDINAGATVTGTGGAVEITAGGGGTSGAGGGIDIDAGAGGTTGNGGGVAIDAGGATTGNSGAVTIQTATPGTAGLSGAISLTTGNGVGSNNTAGDITVTAGNSVGSGEGGKVDINAGTTVTGTAGAVEITAGGGGTSGAGGGIDIDAGAGGTTGNGGNVAITTGGATTGNSGAMTLSTATPGTLGDAGAVNITGGAGKGATNTGGNVVLTAGDSITTGVGAKVDINAGAGGNDGVGGAIEITAGAAGGGDRAGGAIDIDAGAGHGSEPGGAILINAGAAGATGDGGPVTITSGTVTSGTGGAISLTASPGVAATNVGGTITLTAGAGVTSGDGGDIQLTPGDSPSGTAGSVLVGANTAGHDVKLFGATSGAYTEFDASADKMNFVKSSLGMTGALPSQGIDAPYIGIGTNTTPQAITLAAHVLGIGVYMEAANSAAYSLIAGYFKAQTDGSNAATLTQIVGVRPRVIIDKDCASAYGDQSTMTVSGTTAITEEACAGAFYLDAGTGTYTVGTRLNALQAILSGTASVTVSDTVAGGYDVAWIGASANADVDSILHLYAHDTSSPTQGMLLHTISTTAMNGIVLTTGGSGAYTTGISLTGSYTDGIVINGTVADEAIQISGTYDHGIRFTEDPVVGDVTNSFINIGDYTNGIAVEPDGANMFGVVHNVTFAVNVAYWYQAYYTKITTSGTTTSSSIAGHAYRMVVASNLAACYGVQSHVTVSGARTFTSEVTPGSFYLDVGTGSISASGQRVNALQAVVTGGATVTATPFAVGHFFAATNASLDTLVAVQQSSTVTTTSAVLIDIDGTCTYAFDFQGTVSDGWTTGTAGTSVTPSAEYVLIPVDVAGTTNPLFLLAAQTWTAA